MSLNLAPTPTDPSRQVHAATLGHEPGRGRLQGRRVLVVGAGQRNASRNPAYEASKAGQISLARAIAVAGASQGIRCNAVLPGLMDTPMGRDATRHRPGRATAVPFGRQGTGWEVAQACLYLVSHEASYVNAHALVVDGGLSSGVVRAA